MTKQDETMGGAVATLDLTPSSAPETPLGLPGRYEDLGLIGAGGMGEVRRVWDRSLQRPLAMKILRLDAARSAEAGARFLAEAQMTAGLQHTGIIAVYDQGFLPDGRPWLTMREVRGRTFAELYRQDQREGAVGESHLRLRVSQLAQACEAVAYAHDHSVIHRDLKPQNLMVGEQGEVLVMDWGIAVRVGEAEARSAPSADLRPLGATQPETATGQVLGSPGYMPPERQQGGAATPAGDVYALGVLLHELLAGGRPARATVLPSVASVGEAAAAAGRGHPPDELCALCARALAPDPSARLSHAAALAEGLRDWLYGVRRLEQAEELLAAAQALAPRIAVLRAEASQRRATAEALLATVPRHAPEAQKQPGWALEDAAADAELQALYAEMEWTRTLHAALALVPELRAAHDQLAAHYRGACERALDLHRGDEAKRLEALVATHDRGRNLGWLRGDSALTLLTDPPGAEVAVYRYEPMGRRLVPQQVGPLLHAPLHAHVLPHGSYRLELRAPGFAPLYLPVLLARGQRWDGCPPRATESQPIALRASDLLDEGERLVPAGWFMDGGDPDAAESLPRARLWLDAFAIQEHPVTNRDYLCFLNDLVASGREAEALQWAPRDQGQREGDPCLLGRDREGRFVLQRDADGTLWQPDWPVTTVSWFAAVAYAAWAGARRGVTLRLPHEIEWAKAARGVDGRTFPWGDHADPSWARMVDSLPDRTGRAAVTDYPQDESPYGVRGMGGNVRDWCANAYTRAGPEVRDGRPVLDAAGADDPGYRVIRGGCWASPARLCRSAARFASVPEGRISVVGFRLVRDLAGGSGRSRGEVSGCDALGHRVVAIHGCKGRSRSGEG